MNCNECKFLEKCFDAGRVAIWDATRSFDQTRREVALLMIDRMCPINGQIDKDSDRIFDFASFCEQQIFEHGEEYDLDRLLKLYKQSQKIE